MASEMVCEPPLVLEDTSANPSTQIWYLLGVKRRKFRWRILKDTTNNEIETLNKKLKKVQVYDDHKTRKMTDGGMIWVSLKFDNSMKWDPIHWPQAWVEHYHRAA